MLDLTAIKARRALMDKSMFGAYDVVRCASRDIDALIAEVERLNAQLAKARNDVNTANEGIQETLAGDLTQDSLEKFIRKLDEHLIIMLIDDFRGV